MVKTTSSYLNSVRRLASMDPVLALSLSEGSGPPRNLGYRNIPIVQNVNTQWSSGRDGASLAFTGASSSQGLTFLNSPYLTPSSTRANSATAFVIRFMPVTVNWCALFCNYTTSTNSGWCLFYGPDGGWGLSLMDGVTNSTIGGSAGNIVANEWHDLAYVVDSKNGSTPRATYMLLRNGKHVVYGQADFANWPVAAVTDFVIGNNAFGGANAPFRLSEFTLWSGRIPGSFGCTYSMLSGLA